MFETTKAIEPAEGSAPASTAPTAGADATGIPLQHNTDPSDKQSLQGVTASSDTLPQAGDVTSAADLASVHATAYAGFDPAIHRTDAQGVPIRTPSGRYAKKPRSELQSGNSGSLTTPVQSSAQPKIDNLPLAKQLCNIAVNGAVRVFGPEWAPVDKAEADGLSFAFRDYFDARGVPKMPPEVILLLAVFGYALPRLNHENTQSKLVGIVGKVRGLFKRK